MQAPFEKKFPLSENPVIEYRHQQGRQHISHMQVLFKGDVDAHAENQHIAHQAEVGEHRGLLQKGGQQAGAQRDRPLVEKQRQRGGRKKAV